MTFLAGTLVVAAALVGCVPEPDTVDLLGDSITVQALVDADSHTPPDDLETYAGLGWRTDWAGGGPTPQEWLESHVNDPDNPRPEIVVVAFAVNDARPDQGGWNLQDAGRFDQMINTPHPDACVVVVLPGYGAGIDPAHGAELDEARDDLALLVARRDGPTVLVDWQPVVDDRPELMAGDGIHLTDHPDHEAEAANTRLAMYWDGVDECDQMT